MPRPLLVCCSTEAFEADKPKKEEAPHVQGAPDTGAWVTKKYETGTINSETENKKRLSQKSETASFYSVRGWRTFSFMPFSRPSKTF